MVLLLLSQIFYILFNFINVNVWLESVAHLIWLEDPFSFGQFIFGGGYWFEEVFPIYETIVWSENFIYENLFIYVFEYSLIVFLNYFNVIFWPEEFLIFHFRQFLWSFLNPFSLNIHLNFWIVSRWCRYRQLDTLNTWVGSDRLVTARTFSHLRIIFHIGFPACFGEYLRKEN